MCEIFSGQDSDWYSSKTRHFCLKDQSTLIRLGNAFWATIDNIGKRDGVTTTIFISAMYSKVLVWRIEPANFTSLLRCVCLKLKYKDFRTCRFRTKGGLSEHLRWH